MTQTMIINSTCNQGYMWHSCPFISPTVFNSSVIFPIYLRNYANIKYMQYIIQVSIMQHNVFVNNWKSYDKFEKFTPYFVISLLTWAKKCMHMHPYIMNWFGQHPSFINSALLSFLLSCPTVLNTNCALHSNTKVVLLHLANAALNFEMSFYIYIVFVF